MIVAAREHDDPLGEPLRRSGIVRIATKYVGIATDYFERTGRQAEIVEVKGSVELAPLTGLVDAIVDLTATGTTLRENHLVEHEQIADCTARLIANPVSHKLKAAAIDQLVEKHARARSRPHEDASTSARDTTRRRDPRAHARARATSRTTCKVDHRRGARRRRRRGAAADRALRPRRARPASWSCRSAAIEHAVATLEPDVLRALRTAIANVRAVAEAQLHAPVRVELEQGQVVEYDAVPVQARRRLRAGRARAVPVDRGDGGGGRAASPASRSWRSALRPGPAARRTRRSSRPATCAA